MIEYNKIMVIIGKIMNFCGVLENRIGFEIFWVGYRTKPICWNNLRNI